MTIDNVEIHPHSSNTIWNTEVPFDEVFYGQVGSVEGVFVRLDSYSVHGPVQGITCLNDPPRFWPDSTLISVRYDYPVRIDSMVVTRLDISNDNDSDDDSDDDVVREVA